MQTFQLLNMQGDKLTPAQAPESTLQLSIKRRVGQLFLYKRYVEYVCIAKDSKAKIPNNLCLLRQQK